MSSFFYDYNEIAISNVKG